LGEIKDRVDRRERVLVTTLTKRMAEDLTEYLQDQGIGVLSARKLTRFKVEILQDLREGKFDVLIGVNLLREGLICQKFLWWRLMLIKRGFAERSIQTIGRAARRVRAILYADNLTDSMAKQLRKLERLHRWNTTKHGLRRSRFSKNLLTQFYLSWKYAAAECSAMETVYEQVDDMPLSKFRNYSTGSADEGSSEELGV